MESAYACKIKGPYTEEWVYVGTARGHSPEDAAINLAMAVNGYNEDNFEERSEILEEFINEGFRFELTQVKLDGDGEVIQYSNEELG